jgi:putative peptidoglycan lipid II flippase
VVPVFYALDDTRYPVMGSFLAVAVNLLAVMSFIGTFSHRAIALATSISMIANLVFLGVILYRKLQGFDWYYLFFSGIKISGISLLMGVGAWWVHGWGQSLFPAHLTGQIAALALAILAGAGLYLLLLNLAGIREWNLLKEGIIKKLKG